MDLRQPPSHHPIQTQPKKKRPKTKKTLLVLYILAYLHAPRLNFLFYFSCVFKAFVHLQSVKNLQLTQQQESLIYVCLCV